MENNRFQVNRITNILFTSMLCQSTLSKYFNYILFNFNFLSASLLRLNKFIEAHK